MAPGHGPEQPVHGSGSWRPAGPPAGAAPGRGRGRRRLRRGSGGGAARLGRRAFLWAGAVAADAGRTAGVIRRPLVLPPAPLLGWQCARHVGLGTLRARLRSRVSGRFRRGGGCPRGWRPTSQRRVTAVRCCGRSTCAPASSPTLAWVSGARPPGPGPIWAAPWMWPSRPPTRRDPWCGSSDAAGCPGARPGRGGALSQWRCGRRVSPGRPPHPPEGMKIVAVEAVVASHPATRARAQAGITGMASGTCGSAPPTQSGAAQGYWDSLCSVRRPGRRKVRSPVGNHAQDRPVGVQLLEPGGHVRRAEGAGIRWRGQPHARGRLVEVADQPGGTEPDGRVLAGPLARQRNAAGTVLLTAALARRRQRRCLRQGDAGGGAECHESQLGGVTPGDGDRPCRSSPRGARVPHLAGKALLPACAVRRALRQRGRPAARSPTARWRGAAAGGLRCRR